MEKNQKTVPSRYTTPKLPQKIKLYISAFISVPFYRYGEIGNICYTIGKNILDGVILYTMFSMAEQELKVAAILGVVVKYAYPGITMISSTYTSAFIDHLDYLESLGEIKNQIKKLIIAHVGIAIGQSLGALWLLLCFPPVFKFFFHNLSFAAHLLVVIYFLHHACDGSAQIVEGRTWFKIVEIKIRRGDDIRLSKHFWVIYALAQNFQLLLGQVFIWTALGITTAYSPHFTAPTVMVTVFFGFFGVVISKFILPVAYKLKFCY